MKLFKWMFSRQNIFVGLLVVWLALGLSVPVKATLLTIDFGLYCCPTTRLYPDGSVANKGDEVTTQFSSWGVVFDSVPGSEATQLTTLRTTLFPGGPSPELGGTLILNFDPVVFYVGSGLYDISPALGPFTINAFNSGGFHRRYTRRAACLTITSI